MKVMSDILLTNNQKLLENYSCHHVIDVPNTEDLEYLKRVPKYKCKNLRENVFGHSSEINGSIRRFSKLKMSGLDRMLIFHVSNKILDRSQVYNAFEKELIIQKNQSKNFDLKRNNYVEEQLSEQNIRSDAYLRKQEEAKDQDTEQRHTAA